MLPIFGLAILIGLIYLAVRLVRSLKFDTFCKNLKEGKLDSDVTSEDVIDGIRKAEDGLQKKTVKNTREANNLKKETDTIKSHLSDRGVIKKKKTKEEKKK